MIKASGSVRVDLLGGTLDLSPINLILKDVVTLNLATSLKAQVTLEEIDFQGVHIVSLDYKSEAKFAADEFTTQNLAFDHFGPLRFVATILADANCVCGLKVTLKSGSPAGAGLGGSSSMGVVLYKALCQYKGESLSPEEMIARVRAIEAKDLECGPTGYQDYYPAVYSGVLALKPTFSGIEVEQLYSDDLKKALEKSITLVFSGETRLSGINNWEVYKSFFDGNNDNKARLGLQKIASLSHAAYIALKDKAYDKFLDLIKEEGRERVSLYPGIMTEKMSSFLEEVRELDKSVGVKVCGAGGGGCFIIVHEKLERDAVAEVISKHDMSILPFEVEAPN